MDQIVIHLYQWLHGNQIVVGIIFFITTFRACIWCMKVFINLLQFIIEFTVQHQYVIRAFFKKLENLVKVLSYINVFSTCL